MKNIVVFCLSTFVFLGCAGQKKWDWNEVKIEYKAYSRGAYETVSIENHQIFIAKNRLEKPVAIKITDTDWNYLSTTIKALQLENLPNLVAPTAKRLYDGANIANLKITYKGNIYETPVFDDGYPPLEIEKLVTKITSFLK